MSIVYVDTSAILKRVVVEAESDAVRTLLATRDASGDLLAASTIAWLEVWRALRRVGLRVVQAASEDALSGIAEIPIDDQLLRRARRVGQDELRSLDAIHLASAVAVGADELLTYDERLARSAEALGIAVLAPGP